MNVKAANVYFVCLTITIGYGQTLDCSTHPFAADCLQRQVFPKTIGSATIADCSVNRTYTGSIILVNVMSTDSTNTYAQVANNPQPDEKNETCLLHRLRPKFTGYPSVSNIPIDYVKCPVDKMQGYIILVYTCIKAERKYTVKLPQCTGGFNGSKIRIESNGFPDYGWNTTGANCQCTINSSAEFINVTTYKLQLTPRQSVAIVNDKGSGYNSSGVRMNGALLVRDTVRANETLTLKWVNTEPRVVNSSMFWIEMEANGSFITVQCDQQVTTTISTTTTTTTTTTTQTIPTTPRTSTVTVTGNTRSSNKSVTTDMRTRNVATSRTFSTASNDTDETGVLTSTFMLQAGRTTPNNSASLSIGSPSPSPVSGGKSFPLIPVIVGLVVFLILILIILVVVYKKYRKQKQAEKTTANEEDAAIEDDDKRMNTNDGQISDSPNNRRMTSQKDESNFNTKFTGQLPPIGGQKTQLINTNCTDEGGMIDEKKKKKKRKKKHDNDAQEDLDYEKTETGDTEKKRKKKKKKRNKVHPGDEPNTDATLNMHEDSTYHTQKGGPHTKGDNATFTRGAEDSLI